MTGADLANLVNEAALLAAKRGQDAGHPARPRRRVGEGPARYGAPVVIPRDERRRTAYHEAGHALLGMLQPGADPVRKISIVPRGRALGVTLSTPDTDRYAYDEDYLRGRVIGALGGMAAEQVVYDVVTTGSENDLEQVTKIARGMVGRWGMSRPHRPADHPARSDDGPHGRRPRPPSTPWTRRCGGSSTSATRCPAASCANNRERLDASSPPLLERDPGRSRGLRRRGLPAVSSRHRPLPKPSRAAGSGEVPS